MDPELAKQNSHRTLAALGVRINETLPQIEAADELTPQSPRAVAARLVVLDSVIRAGFGRPRQQLLAKLSELQLTDSLTASERELLMAESPTKQQLVDATWLIEAAQAIVWCLGLADLKPIDPCDEDLADRVSRAANDVPAFLATSKLRPFDQLHQQADLHYRLHWAARDARLNGYESPVHEGTVQERRRAIDWVIGVASDWDDMPLDT